MINLTIYDGIVKDTNDPQQMGRCKIWVPALDGEFYDVKSLPWADYVSPFFGSTLNFKVGREKSEIKGYSSYGFWAIPKIGSRVVVFLLNGDINRRVYFGCMLNLHQNRGLPNGRNKDDLGTYGPWNESYEKYNPAYENLREQFQNDLLKDEAQTRGAYERQIAQAATFKDGTEGYAKNIVDESVLDPQSYCIVTPGHHAIILNDDEKNCRIRFKTTAGHQIIFDDTNERIYISTAKGKTWIELDENGHMHIFAADDISIRSSESINIRADKDINIEAQKNINIKAVDGNIKYTAGKDYHLYSGGSIYETCCKDHNTNVIGILYETAKQIHMNGPEAQCAVKADPPSIIPGHEPWSRPTKSKYKRNPNWRK
jgi:phage gp45-like